jgi:class 3 adenylate cyclase
MSNISEAKAAVVVPRSLPLLRQELSPSVLRVARALTVSFALVELWMYFRWLPRWLDLRLSQAAQTVDLLHDGRPYAAAVWAAAFIGMLALTGWCATAGLILWRRSNDLFGILLFLCFVSAGVIGSTDVFEILRLQRTDPWAPIPAYVMYTANALCMLWVFVFPDGRFAPRWTVVLAAAWVAWNIVRSNLTAADISAMGLYAVALNFALLASAVGSLVYRYRWRATAVERNQLKWLLLGCLFSLIAYVAITALQAAPALQQAGRGFLLRVASTALMSLAMIAVPAAMLVAIFRQGLLDVNRLVSRTVLYAALTAVIIAGALLFNSVLRQVMDRLFGQVGDLMLIVFALPLAFAALRVRARLATTIDKALRERTVITVMFTDIVDSTATALQLGDDAWAALLRRFRKCVRRHLENYGGEEIDTAGDGFFATFVGPGGAVHCASNIVEDVQELGIRVRVGLHTGEVERYGVGVTGVAVHVGARLMAQANPGQVLVSAAMKDLLAGSRVRLEDVGEREFKGLPGTFRTYSLTAPR